MKKILLTMLGLGLIMTFPACKKKGCTDPVSVNYDADADEDDGSCKYKGCMDPISVTYNANASQDDGSCVYGGSGGDVTIVAFPQHHGVSIPNHFGYPDSAFVTYNAIDYSSHYDTIYVGEPGEDHIHLEGLKRGKYYVYVAGFDSLINQRVVGGIPVTVTQTTGELDLNVPVTE